MAMAERGKGKSPKKEARFGKLWLNVCAFYEPARGACNSTTTNTNNYFALSRSWSIKLIFNWKLFAYFVFGQPTLSPGESEPKCMWEFRQHWKMQKIKF